MSSPFPASRGQTLVEMIISLAIAVLVISALVVGVVVAIRNASFSKNQSLATKYAQEAIEKIRNYRDQLTAWSDFTKDSCESPPNLSDPSPFLRDIECTPEEGDTRMKVVVTISWSEGSQDHQSQLTTYLTEWQ